MGDAKTVGCLGCNGATQLTIAKFKCFYFHAQYLAKSIVVEHTLDDFSGAFHGSVLEVGKGKGVFQADAFFGVLNGAAFVSGVVFKEQDVFVVGGFDQKALFFRERE